MKTEFKKIDWLKDQTLFEISSDGSHFGTVEIVDGKLTTSGAIGCGNTFHNWLELLWYLQGFNLKIDDLYFIVDDDTEK
jgi:hypothetical protein